MALSAESALRVGIVAGEASGDLLGAALIKELSAGGRQVTVTGIGGPLLQAAGCESLFSAQRLAVMGLVEPLGRLPELLGIRRQLAEHFLQQRPDFFIGIDSPDFNLRLERRLRRAGIATFHYVSPSVWAWRRNRLKLIRQAVDGVLTLFPFESDFYHQANIPSRFVGHPACERIGWDPPRHAARAALGLPDTDSVRVMALLPGSRGSEYRRLGSLFLAAARILHQQHASHFVVPLIDATTRHYFEQLVRDHGRGLSVTLLDGNSEQAMQAADLVVLASGTASLEAMLMGRPMVVAYRLAEISYQLLRVLFYGKWIALPNLLADQQLVPELIQRQASPENIVAAVNQWFDDKPGTATKLAKFHQLREQLAGESTPANAILEWLANE